MLQHGSIMCAFVTDGTQMVTVDNVVGEHLLCCVLLLGHTHQNTEMTQIEEVVVVECRGSYLSPTLPQHGFVMCKSATCGILMGMGGNVEEEWGGNFVLVPITGPHTTEMTLIEDQEDVEWLGN